MSPRPDSPADAPGEQLISVSTHSVGGTRVVAVAGEVDMGTTPRLRSALQQELGSTASMLVVDLSEVQFLGSSGLAVLVETKDAAGERGIPLRLVGSSREVLRPLEATGLTELFAIYPDRAAALTGP